VSKDHPPPLVPSEGQNIMGAGPVAQLKRGQSPLTQPNAPGPTLLGLLSLLPPQFRWTFKHFFSYPTTFAPLVASTTQQSQIQADSGSHFIITYATCICVDAATNLIQQAFIPQLVMLIDSSSQAQLFQQAMHAMAVYGDATAPGVFAIPYILNPASTLTVQHQNQDTVNVNDYIAFVGFKSYPNSDVRNPSNNPYAVGA
jgi:hypothetical protein